MLRTLIRSLALVAALAGSAHAGLLFNEDGRAYEVTFERGNGRVKASIEAKKTVLFECSQLPCQIRLEASGQTVRLTSNQQDVVIKDGKLHARPASDASN
jgi:hypothetical protein